MYDAWALLVDTGQYASFPDYNIGSGEDFTIEVEWLNIGSQSSAESRRFLGRVQNTRSDFSLTRDGLNFEDAQGNSGGVSFPTMGFGDFHVVAPYWVTTITRTSGVIQAVSVQRETGITHNSTSNSSVTGSFQFNQFFRHGTFGGGVLEVRSVKLNNDRHYKNVTSGTGSFWADILGDGSTDATLANFPTDGSQWGLYADYGPLKLVMDGVDDWVNISGGLITFPTTGSFAIRWKAEIQPRVNGHLIDNEAGGGDRLIIKSDGTDGKQLRVQIGGGAYTFTPLLFDGLLVDFTLTFDYTNAELRLSIVGGTNETISVPSLPGTTLRTWRHLTAQNQVSLMNLVEMSYFVNGGLVYDWGNKEGNGDEARLEEYVTGNHGTLTNFGTNVGNIWAVFSESPVPNTAPIANPGPQQTVTEGNLVTLDGSGSSDPDGDPLTYLWTQIFPTSPLVPLSSNTAQQPTFTAPSSSVGSFIRFSLVVNDGTTNSDATTVNVFVDAASVQPNQATISFAGATPTFSIDALTTPPVTVATVDFAGATPTFSIDALTTPPVTVATVDFAGATPTFSIDALTTPPITVATVDFAVTGPTFSINASNTVPGNGATISFAGATPTFSIDALTTPPITVATVDFAVTGPTFSINASNTVPGNGATISFAGATPTFSIDALTTPPITVATVDFAVTGPTFSINASNTVPGNGATISFAGATPTFSIDALTTPPITVATVDFAVTGPTFSINASNTVPGNGATISFAGATPTFSIDALTTPPITVATVDFAVTGPTFSINASNTVPGNGATISFAGATPTFSIDALTTPPITVATVDFAVTGPTFSITGLTYTGDAPNVPLPTYSIDGCIDTNVEIKGCIAPIKINGRIN